MQASMQTSKHAAAGIRTHVMATRHSQVHYTWCITPAHRSANWRYTSEDHVASDDLLLNQDTVSQDPNYLLHRFVALALQTNQKCTSLTRRFAH